MTAIPELVEACELHSLVVERRSSTAQDERDYRALLLRAVMKGATREQIETSCGITKPFLDAELKKARNETKDPKLRKMKIPNNFGGLTKGEYWCPEPGCPRAQLNGNEPLGSAQALALHRVKAHAYRLGAKPMTASIVTRARADTTTDTTVLAKRWGVSVHALRAARSGRTWRDI